MKGGNENTYPEWQADIFVVYGLASLMRRPFEGEHGKLRVIDVLQLRSILLKHFVEVIDEVGGNLRVSRIVIGHFPLLSCFLSVADPLYAHTNARARELLSFFLSVEVSKGTLLRRPECFLRGETRFPLSMIRCLRRRPRAPTPSVSDDDAQKKPEPQPIEGRRLIKVRGEGTNRGNVPTTHRKRFGS